MIIKKQPKKWEGRGDINLFEIATFQYLDHHQNIESNTKNIILIRSSDEVSWTGTSEVNVRYCVRVCEQDLTPNHHEHTKQIDNNHESVSFHYAWT